MNATKTRRPVKTAAERTAEINALKALAEQFETPTDDPSFNGRYDALAAKYSESNVILILAQRPAATACAGYGDWQKAGRQVRKGETGIKIWVYTGMKTRALADAKTPTEIAEANRMSDFKIGTTFDVSQTDPKGAAPAAPDVAAPAKADPLVSLAGKFS